MFEIFRKRDSLHKNSKWNIIAGLGNPGREYTHTRHNVGFDTVDILADKYDIPIDTVKFNALIGKGTIEGEKVILLKPQTYMNLSGQSIVQAVNYYRVPAESGLIVIYDDIYLDVGMVRVRKQGSAGGHNGMKDIIKKLGTEEFARVRIGVGEKPKNYDLKDYVLSHFSESDREKIDEGLINAAGAVSLFIKEGAEAAMNRYNRKNTMAE
ncbi:MAG: aminoacyl-tRNA hydrolase [Lachnospiraceae bacterium]|nr:aminoacyl-tRNA hydrolase [Lachnospiraceae bacterium]